MKTICLHDKSRIESFLRRDSLLQVYSLGDLDDAFWPHTTWYGLEDKGRLRAIVLMYSGLAVPTLLAIGQEELPQLEQLLKSVLPLLPLRFDAHLATGLVEVLREQYNVQAHGFYYKMGLVEPERLERETAGVARLRPADADEVQRFYEESYPDHTFEPQMLQTGQYYGMRQDGRLVCMAGVHVYSPTYRVAALANIATRPEHRGQGCAKAVISHLCRQLLASVEHIGLNVNSANDAAVACYKSLGFRVVGQHEECVLEAPCQG